MVAISASTRLAIELGILPWESQRVLDALLACTRDHVALIAREQAAAAQQLAAPFELLRQHVRQHRSEFMDLRAGSIENNFQHNHRTCPGYINQHKDNGLEYLFPDWRFEQVVG